MPSEWSPPEAAQVRAAFTSVRQLGSTAKGDELEGKWEAWSWRMNLAFDRLDLWQYVTLDTTEPGYVETPPDPRAETSADYYKKSKWAYNLIIDHTVAELTTVLRHTNDAREAFRTLEANHALPADQALTLCLDELAITVAESTATILSFVAKHQQILAKTRMVCPEYVNVQGGIPYNHQIVRGLPKSWNAWSQTIAAKGGLATAPEALLIDIKNEASRRATTGEDGLKRDDMNNSAPNTHASALYAHGKSDGGSSLLSRVGPKAPLECYNCKRQGHRSDICYHPWTPETIAAWERKGYGSAADRQRWIQEHRSGSKGHARANVALVNRLDDADDGETRYAVAYVATSNHTATNTWIFDSGASHSITHDRSLFKTYHPTSMNITLGDGSTVPAAGKGTIQLNLQLRNGSHRTETFADVLHAPSFHLNLLSSTALTTKSMPYTSNEGGGVKTLNKDGAEIGFARIGPTGVPELAVAHVASVSVNIERLNIVRDIHNAVGHPGRDGMLGMLKRGYIAGVLAHEIDAFYLYPCEHCAIAKTARASFPSRATPRNSENPLSVLHSDVAGPYPVESLGRARYAVTLIDSVGWHDVRSIRAKSDVTEAVSAMLLRARVRTGGRTPITIRTDNGGEYTGHSFQELLQQHHIAHQTTIPGTPEQNGVAERANRTLGEKANALLSTSKLPPTYWAEALRHAAYLHNRTPTPRNNGLSPFEATYGHRPTLDKLPTWGRHVWAHAENQHKFSPRALRCRFLGVGVDDFGKKGFRVQAVDSGRILWTAAFRLVDTRFDTTVPPSVPTRTSAQEEHSSEVQEETQARGAQARDQEEEDINPPRVARIDDLPDNHDVEEEPVVDQRAPQPNEPEREAAPPPARPPKSPARPRPSYTYELRGPDREDEASLAEKYSEGVRVTEGRQTRAQTRAQAHVVRSTGPIDLKGRPPPTKPNSLTEEMRSPYAPEWKQAREDEDQSMKDHHVFRYVSRPPGANVIGSRYHYTLKTNSSGDVTRFKTRLIAQGFNQRPGQDFEEAYAPVASLTAIKLGLAYIAHARLEAFTIDVKTAYLYAELDKTKGTRYMEQPPGYDIRDENGERAVCELDKAIYGLPEAAAAWYNHLKSFLDTVHFESVVEDTCVFVGHVDGERVILIIYVDDGIIAASKAIKDKFMATFTQQFDVEEKGSLDGSTFVGLEITYDRDKGVMEVRQEGSIRKLLETADMLECTPMDTPVHTGLAHHSQDKSEPPVRQHDYLVLVGIMQWIVHTRPDVAHAVSLAARWSSNPGQDQWTWLRRILRYFAGTRRAGLLFGNQRQQESLITLHTDADFAGCLDTRRSTTGVVVHAFGSPVIHLSRKQTCMTDSCPEEPGIATSTKEAELVALHTGIEQAEWVARLIKSFTAHSDPIPAYCDNRTVTTLITGTKNVPEKKRHVDIPLKYARAVHHEQKTFNIKWIAGPENMADLLTKPLDAALTKKHAKAIGMVGI